MAHGICYAYRICLMCLSWLRQPLHGLWLRPCNAHGTKGSLPCHLSWVLQPNPLCADRTAHKRTRIACAMLTCSCRQCSHIMCSHVPCSGKPSLTHGKNPFRAKALHSGIVCSALHASHGWARNQGCSHGQSVGLAAGIAGFFSCVLCSMPAAFGCAGKEKEAKRNLGYAVGISS